ncbi:hypothetical protein [Bradyrhizobium sp. LHD-71]|uniref:hypothetical protein n=1 Tax=Bradyrhizobium sp. LHD-71 TaxID=3072141 RepID=UPI002810262E|nr:hypothetical protein [Bradyrhizobium sp. LHD-71]MDQ8726425.1 hypothetical protein [Bradyrhizobium sp. LHD-71]
MRTSLRAYLAMFIVAAGIVGLGYRAVDRWWASIGCYPQAPAGYFLAYCASPQFGNFEHGAYYYNLEPEAVASLKRSEVLFFGTSRAQFALSTRKLSDFFASLGIAPYLLGFGYNEAGAFPLALIREYELKPKAIVILADPFFRDWSTSHIRVTQYFRWRVITELYEYLQKQAFIQVGSRLCGLRPSLCETTDPVVYRSKSDGWWRPVRFDFARQSAVGQEAAITYTAAMASADVAFAERFLAATGVSRSCVVLSAAPSASVNSDAYVTEMGRLLGVRVSLPRLDGLTSFDGSHLTPASAERWSAALLADIGKTVSACAGK